jgi:hypothetical protein
MYDANGFLKHGWYPGKKHGVGKRLLQGATMGIYNPDNRDESAFNKRILSNKIQNAAARERAEDTRTITEKDRVRSMENLVSGLVQMGIPPDKARMISASTLGGGQKAITEVAEGEARESTAKVKKARNIGELPHAGNAGAAAIEAEIATSDANEELADETVEETEARRKEGIPGRKAKSTASKLDYNRNLDEFNTEKTNFDWDTFNTTADVRQDTDIMNASNAFAEANIAAAQNKSGQRMADAMVDEITAPGMAAIYTKAGLSKAGTQSLGPGMINYLPDGTTRKGMVPSYSVVDTRRDAEGNVVGSTPVRNLIDPNSTTAEPAPAPAPAAGARNSLGQLQVDPVTGKLKFTPKGK